MGVKIKRLGSYEPPAPKCSKCNDVGFFFRKDEQGNLYSRECECQVRKRNIERLKRSGLVDLVRRYNFKNYKTPDKWYENTKASAKKFINDPAAPWFYIAGHPGSGKTHLCTAICGQLIARSKEVRYMVWREAATTLKAMVMDSEEYKEELDKYLRPTILYIDDFFKGSVTQADINLAFTILNHRYNNGRKQTIISSERPLFEIQEMDAAIAGRIFERANRGEYIFKTPDRDWRTA